MAILNPYKLTINTNEHRIILQIMTVILTSENNSTSGGVKMSKNELDSSVDNYIELETPKNYIKDQSGVWQLDFKKLTI